MKLYNSLGRKLEDLTPLKPGEISLYTCGPTVYDYMHIGNLRKFIFDDTLRRALTANNLQVNHIMNITDVGHLVSDADEGEDKLEKGAKRSGKTVWEVAQFYLDAFIADMKLVNTMPASELIRATDKIEQQIEMIKVLLKKDYAYITHEAIYFDVIKLDDYGILSGQKLADKQVGVRDAVVTDSNKRNPQDFAVWFFTVDHFADHEMRWPSPWGEGFPGWHLECSAIIEASLGDTIDIHTGGIDNLGTHHVNEMAQSEAAHDGKPLSNYWLHLMHLLVDGRKMSKSLGNFYTLDDIQQKGFSPLAFRLLMLQAHYRTELNFTWESLAAAQTRLLELQNWAALQYDERTSPAVEASVFTESFNKILASLSNDLSTPAALSELSKLMHVVSVVPESSHADFVSLLEQLDNVFGLDLEKVKDITPEQRKLVADRQAAKDAKDFAKADEIREQLAEEDIEVDDTKFGPRWRRTSL